MGNPQYRADNPPRPGSMPPPNMQVEAQKTASTAFPINFAGGIRKKKRVVSCFRIGAEGRENSKLHSSDQRNAPLLFLRRGLVRSPPTSLKDKASTRSVPNPCCVFFGRSAFFAGDRRPSAFFELGHLFLIIFLASCLSIWIFQFNLWIRSGNKFAFGVSRTTFW